MSRHNIHRLNRTWRILATYPEVSIQWNRPLVGVDALAAHTLEARVALEACNA